jgi:CRP-like cAMP-binding protein
MQIVLDALRMLDDGLIQKLGPRIPQEAQEAEVEDKRTLRVVKGPLVDYTYVIGEEEFVDGQKIVREGGHGNWIWVILEGVVEVIKETPNDSIQIARLGEGCFIGGFAHLMHSGSKRSATVKAVGPVQLGVLDTERLSREFNSLSAEFKGILGSLDRRLRSVTERLVDLVLGASQPENPVKGKELNIDKLFERRELYRIQDGQAHVMARRQKDRVRLVTLGKDEYFGYTSFMSFGEDPGLTTIVTSKGIQVHPLDAEALGREHDGLSGTFKGLIQSLETSVSLSIRTACEG